jgi:hypothetical protein
MDALATIQRLGSGRLIEELHEALIATAGEVVETGKPGTITLTLKISNRNPGDVLVMIDEALSRKSPKRDSRGAIFYARDGELHKEDPWQAKMEFSLVGQNTGEIRQPQGRETEERVV